MITFSPAELEILRLEAERARERASDAGFFPRRLYQVERYEFASEYARGAEPAGSEKQQTWLKRIKQELKSAVHVKTGASRTGAGSKNE